MQHDISHTNHNYETFDLNQIFIGREQQLDLFEIYLHRWKEHIFNAKLGASFITSAPSPDNKIQGFFVLLHGRGGYGKSTLLRRYRDMILRENQRPGASKVTVSEVVDWEFVLDGKQAIFHPQSGQEVDAIDYFKTLCGQLAPKLGREPKDFKEYQSVVYDVEEARKEVTGIVNNMQKDGDRYGWLRGLAVEAITSALRTYVPGSGIVLENPSVKKGMDEVAKLTQEQLGRVYTHLHEKLGGRLADYLDPTLHLGLAFGRDLNAFAKNYPLLIFFDTYEEIDEGDTFLRMVMAAAGLRVGWVIAGRDNLWAGSEQRTRSIAVEYGYKELVSSDLGLSINFNAGDVGAFTLSDIMSYFDLLSEKIPYEPRLPKLTKEEVTRVLQVTQGIPLAVKIAAGLYVETANLDAVLQEEDGQREIIDQMVRRYLLHTRTDQDERSKLYGLALLRRANQPVAVSAALGLSPEQARTSFASTLSQLHRRYSFVFTEKKQPTLHQEVRHFLRLWLLEHCEQPEIVVVNQSLRVAYEAALKHLEERRQYSTLKERFTDEQWTAVYLDMTEQECWLDPAEGIRYILPFMIAASVYAPSETREAAAVLDFFVEKVKSPYQSWLEWISQSLIDPFVTQSPIGLRFPELVDKLLRKLDIEGRMLTNPTTRFSQFFTREPTVQEALQSLEELTKLTKQLHLAFPSPLTGYRQELEAALYWRLGATYWNINNYKAVEWCEKAMVVLGTEDELKTLTAHVSYDIGQKLVQENKFAESFPFLNRAIGLRPDDPEAYITRGNAFHEQKEDEQAIADYNTALKLDPNNAVVSIALALVYVGRKEYEQAIEECNHALGLNDLSLPALLDLSIEAPLRSEAAILYRLRGDLYRCLGNYERAIEDINWAIELAPDSASDYEIRGHIYLAGLQDSEHANANYRYSCELDPTNINAAWMAEWTGMGRQRVGIEVVKRLEQLSTSNAHPYIAHVCRGIVLGLRGKVKDGLMGLERAISLDAEEFDAYFWKGMLCAYYYQRHFQKAKEAIEKALEAAMPPALLTPLYWLEKERPEFFEECAKPLLERFRV